MKTVKGTREFYPEQMATRNWLYAAMRAASQSFGYQEWDGPFLETLDLYAAKSGDELVKKQAFVFKDRGGDEVTLRPELTPSLARMVAARQAQLPRPIRWWSFGPFWRYEQPQKGRSREFFQWNVDLLGVDSPLADAEVAGVAVNALQRMHFSAAEVVVRFNNRRLMDAQLAALDLLPRKTEVFRLIDRREKMTADKWRAYALELGLSASQLNGLETVLSNTRLWETSEECQQFVAAIRTLGLADFLQFDPTVIRGLDYYTGTVIEGRDHQGEFRAVFGGGRYDNLVGDVGGERIPGVGFAMGDMVIGLMAQHYGKLGQLRPCPTEVLVTVFDTAGVAEALALAAELRATGLKVEWFPTATKLEKQLKYADAHGIRWAVICGPDERATGTVVLKDLHTRQQRTLPRTEVAQALAG